MCEYDDFDDSEDDTTFKGYQAYVDKFEANMTDNKSIAEWYEYDNSPWVSAFKGYNSCVPHKTVNLLKCLTTDKYRDEIERLRGTDEIRVRKAIKSELPCITVGGTFGRRSESCLIKHSGFICIDIDGKDQSEPQDWDAMKNLIGETFNCVYYVGLSAGGNGIFVVAKIRNPKYHRIHYTALSKEISEATGLKVDMSCSDVARLRGASYDPAPYYNPNPTQYNKVLIERPKNNNKTIIKTKMEKTTENVEAAIVLINTHDVDITNEYKAWLKIALALYDEFGEEGRKYFHLVSCIYHGYDEEDCNRTYDKCEAWGTDVRLVTFFYYCKLHGIVYRKGGMVYDPSIIEARDSF